MGKVHFKDPFAIDHLDDRDEYGEKRFVLIGMAAGETLLFAAYTNAKDAFRLISARRATQYQQDDYFRQNT